MHKVFDIGRTEVRQLTAFQMLPKPLVGIEVRRVGREWENVQARMLCYEPLNGHGAVTGNAVPEEEQRPPRVSQQLLEKANHLARANRTPVKPEVTLASEPDRRQGRKFGPVEAVVQNRSLSARSPGFGNVGSQREAGFVLEQERSTRLLALFFMAGHSCCSHWSTLRSSRSRARRSGRCQENPR